MIHLNIFETETSFFYNLIFHRNPLHVYSLMYETEIDALFGIQDVPKDMEFMIFELKNYTKTGYHWKILPYGSCLS